MRLVVVSDPHYASPAEQARRGAEARAIGSPFLRVIAGLYRKYFWLAEPTAHNHQLERFIAAAGQPDLVIANGDYSCDTAFVGVSDDAAFASANECLARLRTTFGDRFLAVMGDHELGKMSLFGGRGGPRVASWTRCVDALGLPPVWHRDLGSHVLIGLTSSIPALPAFAPEILAEEHSAWAEIRARHQAALAEALRRVGPRQRILLFCHDPTAFPYLAADPVLEKYLPQLERTVMGHLHSEWVFRASHRLAGMPEIRFLGNTIRRLSGALRRARAWRPFRPLLCPSLTGIQLCKDGGFLELELDGSGGPIRVTRQALPW